MTIVLAFECVRGAVLCADTQLTSDGGFKFEDSKVFNVAESYPNWPNRKSGWGVWMAYAGSPQLAHSVYSLMYDALLELDCKPSPSYEEFQKLLQKTLNKVCGRSRGPLQMIWALSHPDSVCLYRTDRRTINPVGDFECLGIGDCSLVRFLAEHLMHIPVKEGIKVAHYIASRAIRYVDGVGGSIEVIGIYPGGRSKSLPPGKDPGPPSWSYYDLDERVIVPRLTRKRRKYLEQHAEWKREQEKRQS